MPMNTQFFSEHRWTTTLSVLVLAAGFTLAYKYARPAVPTEVVMSTGVAGGAYDSFAKRYAAALAEEGITLTLKSSKGASENLERLLDEKSGVDIAFVQNGLIEREKAEQTSLESLGSFFYEPVLVFYRPQSFAKPVQSLGDLRGKRIAIGPEGSGTRALAMSLLALHDIKSSNGTVLLDIGGESAAEALRSSKVDSAMFVGSVAAPLTQSLFRVGGNGSEFARRCHRRCRRAAGAKHPNGGDDFKPGRSRQFASRRYVFVDARGQAVAR
jgi:TRAP-type uncharacterized transport system substrate-binding protein